MLSELLIQNLAIVQQSHIEFASSFNLITGETGAGKSILIKALRILCGLSRATKDMVRQGANFASVSGTWHLSSTHPVHSKLKKYGLDNGEDTLLVRRRISAQGKHTAYVNDISVRTETLIDLTQSLIDFTGQHSSFELKQQHHTDLLDQRVQTNIVSTYQTIYREALQHLKALEQSFDQAYVWQQERELYKQQLSELNQLEPSLEDYTTLKKTLHDSMQREKQRHILQQAQGQLQSTVHLRSIADTLQEDETFAQLACDAKQLSTMSDDLSYDISTRLAGLASNHDHEALQARIALYQKLVRKYQCIDIEGLVKKHETIASTFHQINDIHITLEEHIDALNKKVEKLTQAAKRLHQARQDQADSLDKDILALLKFLGMPRVQFETLTEDIPARATTYSTPQLEPAPKNLELFEQLHSSLLSFHSSGPQHFHFHISSNPGQPLQRMSKVASGGESSRVLLAIKAILAKTTPQVTFVLDEVDTGVSGHVAHQMGDLIAQMAKQTQIVCISHSPQIASWADTHFKVVKNFSDHQTTSDIRKLDISERATEIATFLSGSKTTPESIRNAERLLKENRH